MAKDIEQRMKDTLTPLLQAGEELEYVVYGEIAPTLKKIAIGAALIIVAVLCTFTLLPLHWAWQTIIVLALVLIMVELFYKDVYIGKSGKRLFLCQTNAFGKEELKQEIPLKFINYIDARSDDTHITVQLDFDGSHDFIIIRRKPRKKGLIRQGVNMDLLAEDIFKRKKKK